MSGERSDEFEHLRKTVEKHEVLVEKHSLILGGDGNKFPPVDGIIQVLQEVSRVIKHPQHGNEALLSSLETIRNEDKRRLAFFNGAKWLTILFWSMFSGLVGFVIAFLTMMRTH